MAKISIQVFGEKELENRIKNGKKVTSHCISIRNSTFHGNGRKPFPLSDEIKNGFKEILSLEFHDVEKREWLPPNFEDAKIPEKEDVLNVVHFVKNAVKDPDFTGFTIHCWRGVSRSSAIALGVIYMFVKDKEKAAKYLIKVRRQARPLPRIVQFWGEVFGSNLSKQSEIIRDEALRKMRIEIMKSVGLYVEDEEVEELESLE